MGKKKLIKNNDLVAILCTYLFYFCLISSNNKHIFDFVTGPAISIVIPNSVLNTI